MHRKFLPQKIQEVQLRVVFQVCRHGTQSKFTANMKQLIQLKLTVVSSTCNSRRPWQEFLVFSTFESQTEVPCHASDKKSLEIKGRKELLGYQSKFIPEENPLKSMKFHWGWIYHSKIDPYSIFRSALSYTVLISSTLVKVLYHCFNQLLQQRTVSNYPCPHFPSHLHPLLPPFHPLIILSLIWLMNFSDRAFFRV